MSDIPEPFKLEHFDNLEIHISAHEIAPQPIEYNKILWLFNQQPVPHRNNLLLTPTIAIAEEAKAQQAAILVYWHCRKART